MNGASSSQFNATVLQRPTIILSMAPSGSEISSVNIALLAGEDPQMQRALEAVRGM
jgi:hypothetical protein